MKKIVYNSLLFVSLLFMGCPTRSLAPLFTEKDLIFDPALIGTWLDGQNRKDTYTFQRAGDKDYLVVLCEQKEQGPRVVAYQARLGRLGKYFFFDSCPAGEIPDHHLVPAHLITKMWLTGDTLHVVSLEENWLKKLDAGGQLKLPHARTGDDIVLTAPTPELQQFILSNAENPAAFPDPGKLIRQK
jgi:hypothetical protein